MYIVRADETERNSELNWRQPGGGAQAAWRRDDPDTVCAERGGDLNVFRLELTTILDERREVLTRFAAARNRISCR